MKEMWERGGGLEEFSKEEEGVNGSEPLTVVGMDKGWGESEMDDMALRRWTVEMVLGGSSLSSWMERSSISSRDEAKKWSSSEPIMVLFF